MQITDRRQGAAASHAVQIPIHGATLEGELTIPAQATGIVLFAHGSGSSRFSPRNRFVADVLHQAQVGTLLFDLLTAEEEEIDARTRELRFDIPMLAGRLVEIARWVRQQPSLHGLHIGYFGASTGGGAALMAAAELGDVIGAVVSRGGRPDLAGEALPRVRAPTLLLVGDLDVPVIGMNQWAYDRMTCEKQLTLIRGATHLFEEPGTLEEVAGLAADWFRRHL